MAGAGIHFKLFRGASGSGAPGALHGIPDLWFALARQNWSSVVLVPADEGGSASEVATALAEFGGRLRDSPVTAIVADSMDSESARILSDLQLRMDVEPSRAPRITVDPQVTEPPPTTGPEGPVPNGGGVQAIERSEGQGRAAMLSSGAVVVAIQPVVVEPLGVAIAQAASAVVLCVEVGRTRLASARRTIELIGADRIVGAFLIQ